ncbi:MAG: endolytic transglycosylase MltG [Gammaproteobacteria bacterium]|nr:endolytic transglycosylase MltG [Gammaproteobacteria bacterium]
MRKRLFTIIAGIALLVTFALAWGWIQYQGFIKAPLMVDEEGESLIVAPGASLQSVARQLEDGGVISDNRLFRLMARLRGDAHRIKAGEYLLQPDMSPQQLLQRMVDGKVRHYALTLVEGWNFREMMQTLNENPYLVHRLKGLSATAIMEAIGYPDQHPEGRFLPETYHFPRGMSDVEFLRRAYRSMSERLAYEWENREEGLPLQTPYEALVLASIVEKETGVESERTAIAGVFIRRLQKGMRLQTDPTVIYGMGLEYDGNIRRRDLLADTPYNTYTREGLPPTPIAMPGADALHAVMHPEKSDKLYFVARGDGSHHFSATLAEHNRAVRKYQIEKRRGDYTSSPAR